MAAEPPGRPAARVALLAAAVLVALALVVNARVLDLRPSSGDNLYIVNWAAQTPAGSVLAGDPDFYPEWRPLPYLTVWLQYQWFDLDQAWLFYLENVLIWAACAWLVWRLVFAATGSALAGLFAGALLLVDVRSVPAVAWIIERQTSLACLFGLLAWIVYERRASRPASNVAIGLLLFASALSKEYGLAFAGALGIVSWKDGRRDRLAVILGAVGSYALLRLAAAGGAASGLCEESGYFFQLRTVCYDHVDATVLTQVAYNLAASALDSVWPGFVGGSGQVLITPVRLLVSAIWFGLAVLGWKQGSRTVRIASVLLFCSVALNFLHYRDRNHLASLCAISIGAGLGWAVVRDWVSRSSSPLGSPAFLMLTAGLLAVPAVQTTRAMSSQVTELLSQEPCEAFGDFRRLDPAFVRALKLHYGLADPDCNAAR